MNLFILILKTYERSRVTLPFAGSCMILIFHLLFLLSFFKYFSYYFVFYVFMVSCLIPLILYWLDKIVFLTSLFVN